MFSCVDLYIDKREETWKEYWRRKKKKEKEKKLEEKQNSEEKENSEENPVFVKFKSYNKGGIQLGESAILNIMSHFFPNITI